MARWYPSRAIAAICLVFVVVAFDSQSHAASKTRSVDMTGEWKINDELTDVERESLPEPKRDSGIFSGIRRRTNITIGIPGTSVGVPVPGTGNDSETQDSEGEPLSSYGRVAAIEIRQRPDLFGIDYGKKRVSLHKPDETTTEKVDKRKITTTSGWRGDRYIVRKSADDGSKMSEEFELINDGQQLKWTVIDHPKGRYKTTDVAIYDKVVESAD